MGTSMAAPLHHSRESDSDNEIHAAARRRRYMIGLGALLGGPANVVMQLSLPAVGRGVVESPVASGRFDMRPGKRGRTTLTYLAVAMIGSEQDRAAYRDAVDSVHRYVRSEPGSTLRYNAFDPNLQLWVAACIYRGVADYMELFFGPLDEATADDLYRQSSRFGTTLQVRPELWPADRAAFAEYWDAMLPQLSLDPEVRRYLLDQVVNLGAFGRRSQFAFAGLNRFFTIGFLPQSFRDELGVHWSPRRQRTFETVMRLIGRALRVMPERWRLYPFENYVRDMRERQLAGKTLV
ncbi:oxygenase MpaB family protein [Nocardia sp. NPDC056000]|uniref:oxygenase MpaB family protein n=1 Tax=Nocardia sp. NPDC056000 TaxID=3345674 RepID=UPI0035D90E15